ncbi:hypothetical protein B296_00051049 [Ensete ventricosum]|uniref:Uncharacterized protein n=1 Tax=Ensete ventricosum TaxID=4639 RepID=A0A426YIG9_ENSVE|nr:hypothetical protein B296_00051049 [Ensete ventricosum]
MGALVAAPAHDGGEWHNRDSESTPTVEKSNDKLPKQERWEKLISSPRHGCRVLAVRVPYTHPCSVGKRTVRVGQPSI